MSQLAHESKTYTNFVPLDTIIDSGRVLRRPLGEWANDLSARIRKSENPADLEAVGRGCSALNNAALVFAHAGEPSFAEEICRLQLSWIESFRSVMQDGELSVLSIQPWVNLGRLCRRARDYEGASAYFRTVRLKGKGDEFRQLAEPIYIYETLRNYLQRGDLDGAVEFAYNLEDPLLTSSFMLKTELLLHVSLRRGETEALLKLIKEMPWPLDQFGVLVKYFYTALALEIGGQPSSCVAALSRIAQQWERYSSRDELDSRDLRFGIELCRLAKQLGQSELLKQLFIATSSMVLRARDVLFASQLLAVSPQEGRSESYDLRELAGCSGYGGSASHTTEISAALSHLRTAISNLMDGSKAYVARVNGPVLRPELVHA